jgi:hypothetical protein
LLPAARILVLLRDPIRRALSNYRFSVAHGLETLSFAAAVRCEEQRVAAFDRQRDGVSVSPFAYLRRGLYADQLARWESCFPRQQIGIFVFEHLVSGTISQREVLRFLEIDAAPLMLVPRAEGEVDVAPDLAPGSALEAELLAHFAEPNRRLAQRWGLDLSCWSSPARSPRIAVDGAPPANASGGRPKRGVATTMSPSRSRSDGAPGAARAELFFILGRGRSGTTLITSLLNGHSEIAVAPEALFLLSLRRRYRRSRWTTETVRRFVHDLWREDRMRRWSLVPEQLATDLLAAQPRSYADACTAVYRAHAIAVGKPAAHLLGDKNPHYSLFARDLLRLYPQARCVFITRDYRDNIASFRHLRFDATSTAALARRWSVYNQAVATAAAGAPDRFLRLRFEDLVHEPRSTLDRVCAFLGASPHPGHLDQRRSTYRLPQWHDNVERPIEAESVGRWRQVLTPGEVALADALCQPLGGYLGYPPATRERPNRFHAATGVVGGEIRTLLERLVFLLPLAARARIIRAFRRATGNVI